MENNLEYYVGLDIGTSSVGFCATDKNYNVINKKSHDLWGVMLFDEAQTAEKRRAKRCSRRGVQRQKEKLMLLRSLFEEEINKVDSNFFARLKASSLWEDDKESAGIFSRNSLFFDSELDDKKFHKKYATIYHLRDALIKAPAEDIRFLYLAIHNMLKHRGNFLSESFSMQNENSSNIASLFESLQAEICGEEDSSDYEFLSLSNSHTLSAKQLEDLKNLDKELSKSHFSVSALTENFKNIFNCTNQNQVSLLRAICGGTVNAKSIFSNKLNDLEIDAKIDSFGVEDETFAQFVSDVSSIDEQASNIILCAKAIYDKISFKKILGENSYFCSAMVEKYELHKKQLEEFKDVIKVFYPEKYTDMFKTTSHSIANYAKYIQGANYNSVRKEKDVSSKCSKNEFYKYVKNVLESNQDALKEPRVEAIIKLIDEDNFLPKLRTSANSIIPYQLNKFELEKILEQSKQKYPFLTKKDEDGLTTIDKIISILEYKIPYFVGPLSTKNSKNAWIEKRLDEKILPWNIEKVVDYDKCEQEFIKRMQNNCSYLSNEPVLPKCSLLYSEYMVLQELNNLQINGKKLPYEIKSQLLNLFKELGTIKISTLKSFLKQNGFVSADEVINISGIDEKFASNLNIYKNFNKILNGEIEKHLDIVEDIIAHATYVSDKNRFQKWLKKTYSKVLNEQQIKEIKSLKLTDWGKFSRKFLDGILGLDTKTGEYRTIIQIMREEPLNLMEVLAKYEFDALNVEETNKDEITYEDIESLYCSPAVKRGVWQSVKIVKEIEKILGTKPSKIFIEVTRYSDSNKKGKKTDTRKKKMEKLYKSLKAESSLIKETDINEARDNLKKAESLDSKKLYLYFTQLGRCMYTGEKLDFNALKNNDYDIDHIFPQSVIKDDSFDNLVLVKRKENIDKSNDVVSPNIQMKMKPYWQYLKNNGLISNEKLSKLLRTEKLTEEEKKDFVARQIIITNQSAKSVIDLFKTVYGSQNVVYSKANNVSMFRNYEYKFSYDEKTDQQIKTDEFKQSLIKCRDMNDLHHAKDAYLNIFVGNLFDEKYSKRFYLKDKFEYGFNLNNTFIKDMAGVYEKEKDLQTVQRTMESNTPHISFLPREKYGMFYKETIYGVEKHQKDFKSLDEIKAIKNNNENWNGGEVPLKSNKNPLNNTLKYGYFTNGQYSYFSLIEYNEKKKTIKTFIGIPFLYAKDVKNEQDFRLAIEKITGLKDFKILVDKVKPGTIFKIGCGYFKLAGNTGDSLKLHNFNQLFLPTSMNQYVKMVSKIYKILTDKNIKDKNLKFDGENIVFSQNRLGEKTLITKEKNLELYKELVKHLNKAFYREVSIGTIGKKLKNSYETFNSLDCQTQVFTIGELLKIINSPNGGNLLNVGESKTSGTLSMVKRLSDKPLSIVYSSPTGYYEKELKLN